MKKKSLILLISILLVLILGFLVYLYSIPKINYLCYVDSDCKIINKGNCCGHYPVCANKNSRPNTWFVGLRCIITRSGSICGWSVIDECKCIENKCKGMFKGELNTPL